MDYNGGLENQEYLYNLEAEQSVLGALILDPDVLPTVLDYVKIDTFYKKQHKELFSVLLRMFSNGQTSDVITIMNEAVSLNIFETSAMAKTYIKGITELVPTISNVESYCKILEEKYYKRRLLEIVKEIENDVQEGGTSAANLIDSAEQKIFEIRQGRQVQGLVKIDDILISAYDRLQKITGEDKDLYVGATTGFSQLDLVTSGLNNSDLIIVAARPGMGKTSFAVNMATNLAKKSPKATAIFTLEMSGEQLVTRMLSSEALVNSNSLRTGLLSGDDWFKLSQEQLRYQV